MENEDEAVGGIPEIRNNMCKILGQVRIRHTEVLTENLHGQDIDQQVRNV